MGDASSILQGAAAEVDVATVAEGARGCRHIIDSSHHRATVDEGGAGVGVGTIEDEGANIGFVRFSTPLFSVIFASIVRVDPLSVRKVEFTNIRNSPLPMMLASTFALVRMVLFPCPPIYKPLVSMV